MKKITQKNIIIKLNLYEKNIIFILFDIHTIM
jgi:hypothetical protein